MTTDPAVAAAQLAALRSGRAAMAERAMQPWWYDALLGLLVFGLLSGVIPAWKMSRLDPAHALKGNA